MGIGASSASSSGAAQIPSSLTMQAMAQQVLKFLPVSNERSSLDTRFRLQLVAGQFSNALQTLARLRQYDDPSSARSSTNYIQYVIYARAKLGQAQGDEFDAAFNKAFTRAVGSFDDVRAAYAIRRFVVFSNFWQAYRDDLDAKSGKTAIPVQSAVALIHDYQLATMYQAFARDTSALIAQDDRRRYKITEDVTIPTPDHRIVCAYVMRPKAAVEKLTTLLEYSIYADRRIVRQDPRLTAAHGFAGVMAYTPGKACSPGQTIPYVNEGIHVVATIDWIVRRPWSDGRVGMYGGSYNSFAQWAAAKRRPSALRALMASVPNAPGIDTPMEANIFETWDYPWPQYTTSRQWLDASSEGDPNELARLENAWYVSGRAYRSLDEIQGRPNPVWDSWLDHPSYDGFWQSLIPYGREFADLHVPVLITDGYLGGQNVGGLYYYSQYVKYDPAAETYFVLGPYDHIRGQFGTVSGLGSDVTVVDGYHIDPAAALDIESLRYQWFDYVFKEASKPAILGNRINYEVMHGNHWEHAASIDAMHLSVMRRYLSATPSHGEWFVLDTLPTPGSVSQSVDLADRKDVNRVAPASGPDAYLGYAYESAPLASDLEIDGVFSGQLDFECNKRDFDFNVAVYDVSPNGDYEAITDDMARASYVNDRSTRRFLTPMARTRLDFTSNRITSWKILKGSRLIVVVSIQKDPGYPINYGTGRDVSDETIADAKIPLCLRWYGDSFIDFPVR